MIDQMGTTLIGAAVAVIAVLGGLLWLNLERLDNARLETEAAKRSLSALEEAHAAVVRSSRVQAEQLKQSRETALEAERAIAAIRNLGLEACLDETVPADLRSILNSGRGQLPAVD